MWSMPPHNAYVILACWYFKFNAQLPEILRFDSEPFRWTMSERTLSNIIMFSAVDCVYVFSFSVSTPKLNKLIRKRVFRLFRGTLVFHTLCLRRFRMCVFLVPYISTRWFAGADLSKSMFCCDSCIFFDCLCWSQLDWVLWRSMWCKNILCYKQIIAIRPNGCLIFICV